MNPYWNYRIYQPERRNTLAEQREVDAQFGQRAEDVTDRRHVMFNGPAPASEARPHPMRELISLWNHRRELLGVSTRKQPIPSEPGDAPVDPENVRSPRKPLARAVGAKGYHANSTGPYTVR